MLFAAEWVLPITSGPIRDGIVAVEGSRIAWVGPRRALPSRFLGKRLRAYPRSVLLPGWVNAHSHLNLTAALGALTGSVECFPDWIRSLLQLQAAWTPEIRRQSVVAGLDLLLSTGTTTIAHSSTLPAIEPFIEHPARTVVFHEPIGFRADLAGTLAGQCEEWIAAARRLIAEAKCDRVTVGLAPHAPYSVSPALFKSIVRIAERHELPLSTHVSETPAEAHLLRDGSGPFRPFLEERGAWDPSWRLPGVSPVCYLSDLGALNPSGTAVHCNYLSDEDIALLARGALIPVWCPGSHQFFGHPVHPAGRLVSAGVPVALGTDSLASNSTLNMLREVRLAAASLPDVDRAVWLRAATITAAQGLGVDSVTGSLEEGKAADLQILETDQKTIPDPEATLFEGRLRVRIVTVDGVEVRIK